MVHGEQSRTPWWLIALLFTVFVLYTDDYVIAGILPELAHDMGVTAATAGQLVSAFSLTIVIGAPLAALTLVRVPRKTLFVCSLTVFCLANIGAWATPSYPLLLACRVLAATGTAAATPAVFAFTAGHAPARKTGKYLAIIAIGSTGSIAAGVPLGTWIGGVAGWRTTFAVMALLGAVAIAAVAWVIPTSPGTATPPLRTQLRLLTRLPLTLTLVSNAVLLTGAMLMLTYLAPFLADTTDASVGARALGFALAGLAGVLALFAGGAASDRFGPSRALTAGIVAFMLIMALMTVLWILRPVPLPVVFMVASLWGAASFWNTPPVQALIHQLAGPASAQALALNTSGTYIGATCGAALGGVGLSLFGTGALPITAFGCGVAALTLFTVVLRRVSR